MALKLISMSCCEDPCVEDDRVRTGGVPVDGSWTVEVDWVVCAAIVGSLRISMILWDWISSSVALPSHHDEEPNRVLSAWARFGPRVAPEWPT